MNQWIKTVLVCWIVTGTIALYAEPLHCSGTATDSDGNPVAAAQVSLHVMTLAHGNSSGNYDVSLLQETTTDQTGGFQFDIDPPEQSGYRVGVILVDHAPLALGWTNWNLREDTKVDIVLGPSLSLSGSVVTTNDEPVAEAQVEVFMLMMPEVEPRYLTGQVCPKQLTGVTDARGRFQFDRIPSGATAEFLVTKPGRATTLTFSVLQGTALNYRAGQEDIRIVQSIEGTIQGRVIDKSTGQGIGGIQLLINKSEQRSLSGMRPIFTKSDGSFIITRLVAGNYHLKPILDSEQATQWADTSLTVEVTEGQAVVDATLELGSGGLLEATITSSTNNTPLKGASVSIRDLANNQWLHTKSDEHGLARIRLTPGQYRINSVNKNGYQTQNVSTDITIEEGQTIEQAWQLGSLPTIAGTVTDADGDPLAGVKLRVMPMGHQDVTSDAEGHFTVSWDPSRWGSRGMNETTFCLVARHQERELGLVTPIQEDQTEANLQLKPTVSVSGQIVDSAGNPIAQAQARVMLRFSNWGSSLSSDKTQADSQGRFTIKALPVDQKYNITALADGYGQAEQNTDVIINNHPLDLGTFTLPLADQTITGKVVDLNDKPVANARIYAYGDGQPDQHNIQTDDKGEFVIKKICAGRIRLHANYYEPGQAQMYGSLESEGGATDVIITVSPQGNHQGFAPRSPKALMGKSLPDLKDLDESLAEVNIEGQPLLLCFWDMQQRPARHSLIQLARQSDLLQQKGVTVIAIQSTLVEADALNEWIQKQQIPFKSAMITGDIDKTKFAWGVKALPWMILTNKEHQVVAEGFSVRKLKENLTKLEDKVEEAKEMPR